jgi:catechol 2,3-dioxygenase-like lactoylglutathione lyase family enzyme
MPTRFDHAVIAVRDLDAGIKQFQRLGFDVRPGGRHTGRGTHNALFRFGLDYVELLSVYDEDEARANNSIGRGITDLLTDRDTSLIGYALATTNIEQDAQRFRGTGTELPNPNHMSRKRPDGQQLSWRTLAPGGVSWGRPWPFLIQWDTPDEQRLQIDLPGTHPNGATHWVQIAITTQNLASTLDVYQNQLGLELIKRDTDEDTYHATFSIGKGIIDIFAPNGNRQVPQILAEKWEGPFALTFSVNNLDQTQAFLEGQAIKFTSEPGKLTLDPSETGGVLINFIR